MPDSPHEFSERWNPDEPTQLFWIDDAFGITQYEDDLVRDWNRTLSRLPAMLKNGATIVMTSRDYIYKMARDELKRDTFPLLHEAQVVIDVQELNIDEKRQILYNHIKLGSQPRGFRSKIKPHLETAANRPFHPRSGSPPRQPVLHSEPKGSTIPASSSSLTNLKPFYGHHSAV